MFLKGVHISNYQDGKENSLTHIDPYRVRKLLLHKREIIKLGYKKQVDGLTFVPLKMYFSKGKVKILLGVCKGKKKYDKRESIKERDIKRNISKMTE